MKSRFRIANFIPLQRRFDAPRWSGSESLEGKTLLIHTEQGLGDTLQFCRYIPLLEARGARVVFEVQPVLRRFLGRSTCAAYSWPTAIRCRTSTSCARC